MKLPEFLKTISIRNLAICVGAVIVAVLLAAVVLIAQLSGDDPPAPGSVPTQSTDQTTLPEDTTEYTAPSDTTESQAPTNESTAGGPDPDPVMQMVFTPVQETVTAKIETNLRDIPSQGEDSTVLYTLQNGETARRTGISDSGWSRLEWKGKTCYAVSSYLTTDLDYKPPVQIQTPFTKVHEQVTAKDAVNLRTLPSMDHPEVEVVTQLQNGQVAIRTGINEDVGWSRVEYKGQTLYCISSYLKPYTEPAEETPPEQTQPQDTTPTEITE